MDEDRKRKLVTVFVSCAVVLAFVVWLFTRGGGSTAAGVAPEGTAYTCKSCNNHFTVSTAKLNDFQAKHYGEKYPCPKCNGTELIRSVHCAKCGEYYPAADRGADPDCPKCGHKPGDTI